MYKLVLYGNVRSKKNNKRIYPKINPKTNKPYVRVLPSKEYTEWEKKVVKQIKEWDKYEEYKKKEWNYPLEIHFKFFRRTRHKFDYNNMSQGIQDILVDLEIIKDDSMNHVIPVFNGPYGGWELDKDNPRIELVIVENG